MPGKKVITPTKSPSERMTTRSATTPKKTILSMGKHEPDDEPATPPLRLTFKFDGKTLTKSSGAPSLMTDDSDSIISASKADDDDFEDEFVDDDAPEFTDEIDDYEEGVGEEDDEFDFDDAAEEDEYLDGDESVGAEFSSVSGTPSSSGKGNRKRPRDEEDAWLEALEEGRLHEVDDELKKIKDPKLMTRRQRALLESKSEKKKLEAARVQELDAAKQLRQQERLNMDEEAVAERMVKARRRRQYAEEKKEKDKKQTIDRLLKKKNDKPGEALKSGTPGSNSKSRKKKLFNCPRMTYVSNQNGFYLVLPENAIPEFELLPPARTFPSTIKDEKEKTCANENCNQPRKYCCKSNGLPCCSLQCYKVLNDIILNVP